MKDHGESQSSAKVERLWIIFLAIEAALSFAWWAMESVDRDPR